MALRILFLVTEDWYFCSHRLPVARALRDMGVQVYVMTRINRLGEALQREGFSVVRWRVSRGSLNPFREVDSFFQVVRAYRRLRPDLAHHVALKPVVYGGIAARLCGGFPSVGAIAGLGHVFTSESLRMRLVRRLLLALLRISLGGPNARTILQNPENREVLIRSGVVCGEHTVLIPGSGVDTREFTPTPEPAGVPMVVFASRMLWDKGVGEFVAAAAAVKKSGISARFALVGDCDPANPASIPETQLRAWADSGVVEWWGRREDMPSVFALSNVVCFPSYREGLPKVLVEAMACGRAVVTTDVPGCRDAVHHGENGLLVPARDPEALSRSLSILLQDPGLRAQMGRRGREMALESFSVELVIHQTMAVYRELLRNLRPDTQGGAPQMQ